MAVNRKAPEGTEFTASPRLFRRVVKPAYHRDWNEALAMVVEDPLQRRRIEELEDELSRNGFQRPVILGVEHWWNPRPVVFDGVHRSVAAMRLGIGIPVRFGYDTHGEYDHTDIYRVTARGPLPDEDGYLMEAVLNLSSFRCSGGPWIQTDIASGTVDGPVDVYLPRHIELREKIAEELQSRLLAAEVDAAVQFVEGRTD